MASIIILIKSAATFQHPHQGIFAAQLFGIWLDPVHGVLRSGTLNAALAEQLQIFLWVAQVKLDSPRFRR